MARKIVVSEEAVAFRAADGQRVVYVAPDEPFRDGQLLYSPDGSLYYELDVQDFDGSGTSHELTFEDPHRHHRGQLSRTEDELVVDGVTYSKVTTPRELQVVPLPEAPRRPEHLLRMPDGRLIYVSVDAITGDTSSLRVFVGDGRVMRQIRVEAVERIEALTEIHMDDPLGSLCIPHGDPGNLPVQPFLTNSELDERELELMDLSQFVITETHTGVTIYPR